MLAPTHLARHADSQVAALTVADASAAPAVAVSSFVFFGGGGGEEKENEKKRVPLAFAALQKIQMEKKEDGDLLT